MKKDPSSAGTDADVEENTKLSLSIYRDTNAAAEMIDGLEWTRLEAERIRNMMKAEDADAATLETASALGGKLRAVEGLLIQPTIEEEDQKSFRGPLGLYLKLVWLNAEVGTGAADVSGGADLAPTEPEREVFALLDKGIDDARRRYRSLMEEDVPAFNRAMQAKGLPGIAPVKEVLPEFPPEREKREDE